MSKLFSECPRSKTLPQIKKYAGSDYGIVVMFIFLRTNTSFFRFGFLIANAGQDGQFKIGFLFFTPQSS
jgi:hypothetical protein